MKRKLLKDCMLTLLGTFLLAAAIYIFTAPNLIAPGGVTGLATALNYISKVPIGLVSGIINLPLLILGYCFLGKKFIFKTLLSVVSFTFIYDYLMPFFPEYKGDPMIACIFGGALIGLGTGLTFMADSSTGGLDISSKIIQKKFPHVKIGMIVFISDVVVILFAAYVFQDITTAMYAIIAMFVCGKVIDAVLYGLDVGTLLMIITKQGDKVASTIIERADRGVTKLSSVGAYTNEENETLLCAVRQNEYQHIKNMVYEMDPDAFLIVTTASEVFGEGFKENEKLKK